jgi:serine protease Do
MVMTRTKTVSAAGATLAAGFLLSCGWMMGHASATNDPTVTAPAPVVAPVAASTAEPGRRPSFANLVSAVEPAVVHIRTTAVMKTMGEDEMPPQFREFFGQRGMRPQPPQRRQGTGSGFVIREDGIVLTNAHVVDGAKEITVTLHDGRELQAKVLGRDEKTDLAVLKLDAKDLPVAKLGDSSALAVGDWVVAIGNPFGLSNTVTAGIVSAKGRAIGAGPYDDFIQTDAPINPGNSGGPLFDEAGNVVGINSAIWSQSGGNIGIGFAIPINLAKELVPQLEEKGHVTRGWLGVTIQQLSPDVAESLGIEGQKGALVTQVSKDSPAAKAGIEPGDVITRYDGSTVGGHNALPPLVASTPIGKDVEVQVLRQGETKTLEVSVAKLDDPSAEASAAGGEQRGRLGLALRELTPEERAAHELAKGEGVMVTGVEPDSPAEEAGIKAGDVVLRVNRAGVGSVGALKAEVERTPKDRAVLLLVRPSEGTDRFAALPPR